MIFKGCSKSAHKGKLPHFPPKEKIKSQYQKEHSKYVILAENKLAEDSNRKYQKRKFAKPGFGRESGTSISAALTAGATALFVNWGLQSDPPRYFTNREIKSLLIRGATRSSNLLYPNREWGYGTLNLYQIFQVLL